jgi:PPOX class probable F420-dependent enzyme
VKQRDLVTMTASEVEAMLKAHRKVQIATINPDGTPHLVAMYYGVLDGQIAFWTYRTSQKALNLARDPRITCLVESGEQYYDLRGVSVTGMVRVISEPGGILEIGRLVAASMGGVPEDILDDYVANAARKRFGYLVEPSRVVSWDHGKLAQQAPASFQAPLTPPGTSS